MKETGAIEDLLRRVEECFHDAYHAGYLLNVSGRYDAKEGTEGLRWSKGINDLWAAVVEALGKEGRP